MNFSTKNFLLIVCTSLLGSLCYGQAYVVRDIRSFGAKGDGKTNDHAAFVKAADFFNQRKGNGKLTISTGTYIVGKQVFMGGQPNKPAFGGENVLHFKNVRNFAIQGFQKSVIKYTKNLRFGAFDPKTGQPYLQTGAAFVNIAYIANIGMCIYFENSQNIDIKNIELNGNNQEVILGGVYGDIGIQTVHFGIFIQNSNRVRVDSINVHHFALDGICVSNVASRTSDSISLKNSRFEYNMRQGLSWVGGNHLLVKNCKFNHTGKVKYSSPPGAGVDIEAEVGPIRNGLFENCEFINNSGQGVVADSGDSGDCAFVNCTFWGTTNYAIWVTKPGFTFTGCNIYGAIVHGYNSPDDRRATKFIRCTFEDKAYNGTPAYGTYMIESNQVKRMTFIDCTIICNTKRLLWLTINPSLKPEEKYQLRNCKFIIRNTANPQGDIFAVIRGVAMKNCRFEFTSPDALKKGWGLAGWNETSNVDQGGNTAVYAK